MLQDFGVNFVRCKIISCWCVTAVSSHICSLRIGLRSV